MKSPSSRIAGASSSAASRRSFSSQRVIRPGCDEWARGSAAAISAAPPDPPAMGFFRLLSVDLPQLARRPLDGVFGLRALYALGEHVHDDILRVDLGGLGRRRSRVSENAGVVGGGAEALHRLVDRVPQRSLLPHLGRADREAFRNLEPLAELLLAVEPLQAVLG